MIRLGGRLSLLTAGALLCGGLAACTADDGPAPEDTADALAEGLSRGRLDGALFAGRPRGAAQRAWERATEGLGEATAEVSVAEVTEDESGDDATARLGYVWDLPQTDETWEQEGTARLVRAEDGAWSVRLGQRIFGLRDGERLDLSTVQAPRAEILGAGEARIVRDRRVLRFGVDKAQVSTEQQAGSAARQLARLVDVDAGDLEERVRAAGEKAFVEAIVLRESDATASLRAAGSIGGVGILEDTLPLAPTREFARPILGTVGQVTAEVVEKSGGAYEAGDEAGLSGLQARYDEQLRGTPGVEVVAVDGDRSRTLFETDPVPGEPLRTTLDPDLQVAAERILADVGPASALVALRPSTGDLLAAASGPGSGGLNTATFGQYAPGSTFKIVSSLALLRAGLDSISAVSCPNSTVVDGKRFENYDDYPAGATGRITLAAAVANSCNTAFVNARGRAADLAGAAAALGLGVDHDLGFPAYFGQVPEPESETSRAAAMIGQGQVLASPMVMATVAASVADGRTVVPRLLPDHAVDDAAPDRPLTSREAATLRRLLQGVVTEGSGSALADVPGPPVIAKTGTAEFGEAEPLQTHAWMVGAQGDLAVAVFVEVGDSGSRTAGPLLERLLRAAR